MAIRQIIAVNTINLAKYFFSFLLFCFHTLCLGIKSLCILLSRKGCTFFKLLFVFNSACYFLLFILREYYNFLYLLFFIICCYIYQKIWWLLPVFIIRLCFCFQILHWKVQWSFSLRLSFVFKLLLTKS